MSDVETLTNIFGRSTFYELSHLITPGIPSWPSSAVPIQQSHVITHKEHGGSKWKITLGTDAGTHIDSPYHFFEDKQTVTDLNTRNFFVPLCIIDITDRAAKDADAQLMIADVEQYEKQYGQIPRNAFVAMRSGWVDRWGDVQKFSNFNTSETSKMYPGGKMHFPGFNADAVDWLIKQRSINAIGVDTYSFDPGCLDAFPVHKVLLTQEKYGIENMNLTADVPASGCFLIALPARIKDSPECWIRCVAVHPDKSAKL